MTYSAPPTEGVTTPPISGMCTACGAIETLLIEATGTRNFSAIGESDAYPAGYGCELCS